MTHSADFVLRRSVLKVLIVALAGCGGEQVVVETKSSRLEKLKGAEEQSPPAKDPKPK